MKDPNDKRTLLALALCMIVLAVWQYFAPPPPEPVTVDTPVSSSPSAPAEPGSTPAAPVQTDASDGPVASVEAACVPGKESLASASGTPERNRVALEVDACGRGIARVAFPGWPRAAEVTPWWDWLWDQVTGAGGPWVPTLQKDGLEELVGPEGSFAVAGFGPRGTAGAWTLSRVGSGVQAERTMADGLVVTQLLTPGKDPWTYDLAVTWTATRAPVTGTAWIASVDRFADADGAYDTRPHLAAVVDEDLEQLLAPSEVSTPQGLEGPVAWFGVEDRYFLAATMPKEPTWGTFRWEKLEDARTAGVLAKDGVTVSPGTPLQLRASVYVGAKDVERLAAVGGGLEEAAALGMWGFFSKVLLFFLGIFHAGVGNWGVAILLLTLLVRIVFYPLTASAFKAGKVMQALQPKIKELQERHGEDKETLNREMLKLFAKHKANPLGGCLPMLVQMPIFFALYNGLMHTPDLYHAGFLFVRDLSAPDPWGVFPGLMAVGMVLQQRLTPMTGMDPDQARMMKFMPLIFALFMFSVPAGLSVYYATNTLLSIAQQWYNTRTFQLPVLEEDA